MGPEFRITDNKLLIAGHERMLLPLSTWFHVDIEAPVGKDANGTWTLTVALPGAEPRIFTDLPTGSPDFGNLTWVGWSSTATDRRVFFLDHIVLTNDGIKP